MFRIRVRCLKDGQTTWDCDAEAETTDAVLAASDLLVIALRERYPTLPPDTTAGRKMAQGLVRPHE